MFFSGLKIKLSFLSNLVEITFIGPPGLPSTVEGPPGPQGMQLILLRSLLHFQLHILLRGWLETNIRTSRFERFAWRDGHERRTLGYS